MNIFALKTSTCLFAARLTLTTVRCCLQNLFPGKSFRRLMPLSSVPMWVPLRCLGECIAVVVGMENQWMGAQLADQLP